MLVAPSPTWNPGPNLAAPVLAIPQPEDGIVGPNFGRSRAQSGSGPLDPAPQLHILVGLRRARECKATSMNARRSEERAGNFSSALEP